MTVDPARISESFIWSHGSSKFNYLPIILKELIRLANNERGTSGATDELWNLESSDQSYNSLKESRNLDPFLSCSTGHRLRQGRKDREVGKREKGKSCKLVIGAERGIVRLL